MSISSLSEEEDVVLSSTTAIPKVLVELVKRPKERPVGLGDQLVRGRMVPRNEAEIRLYELIDNHLP